MFIRDPGRVSGLVQEKEEAHTAAAFRVAIRGLAEEDLAAADERATGPGVVTEGVDGDRDRLSCHARRDDRRIDDLGRRSCNGRKLETRDDEAGEDEPAQRRASWP